MEIEGVCDNFKRYNELYGKHANPDGRDKPGQNDCHPDNLNKIDRRLTDIKVYGRDQFTLCADPNVKRSNSGDSGDVYVASVFVTTRTYIYPSPDQQRYRFKFKVREVFPWIRSRGDLRGFGCTHVTDLEIFSNFDSFPEVL